MFRSRAGGARRLGAGVHAPSAHDGAPAAPAPAAQPQQQPPAPPARGSSRPTSKAKTLAAFHCLVESAAARARCESAEQPRDAGAAASPRAPAAPDAAAAAGAAPAPAAPAAAAAADPAASQHGRATVQQALPTAAAALRALQAQLARRAQTYLYQVDGLLSKARGSLAALAALLSEPACQQRAGAGTADALLHVCTLAWEVVTLLLQHHHAAEPANTAQQAGELHAAARTVWEAWELASQAAEPEQGASALGAELLTALDALARAAAAWTACGELQAADWCHVQLRMHLSSLASVANDARAALAVRQQMQRLQLAVLAGGLGVAARQGQQALWANLASQLQGALRSTVLEAEQAISTCLELAGSLAQQAAGCSPGTSPPGGTCGQPETSSGGAAGSAAVRLLELAAQLLEHCSQQAAALAQQEQQQLLQEPLAPAGAEAAGAGGASAPIRKHIRAIQQQVLLQLAHAYLAAAEHGRVLECATTLRCLAADSGTRPHGLVRLSCLALLGQGKVGPASSELCAWLQHGTAGGEEAAAAVKAFLAALSSGQAAASSASATATARPGAGWAALGAAPAAAVAADSERQAAVQRVAAAALERCRAEPALALPVVLQLLALEGASSHVLALQALVVQLLAVEEVGQLLLRSPSDCARVHTLLHTRGASHHAAGRFAEAIQLLTPACFFSAGHAAARSARLLAAALLHSRQPGRALEYAAVAEQQQGQPTALGCLLRLQAALQLAQQAQPTAAGTAAAAATEALTSAVQGLRACSDFDGRAMEAAVSLCLQAGRRSAAWAVLLAWRDAATPVAAQQAPRLLQVLSLMWGLLHSTGGSAEPCVPGSPAAAAAGSAQQGQAGQQAQAWQADVCATFRSCAQHLRQQQQQAQSGAGAAASGAGSAPASAGCNFSSAQLVWLVDLGLQLALDLAAARSCSDVPQRASEAALDVLQGVATACDVLQQQAPQPTEPTEQQGGATAASAAAAAAATAARRAAGAALAASLLLCVDGTQARSLQLRQASQLLQAARQGITSLPACADPGRQLEQLLLQLDFALACCQAQEQRAKRALQQLAQHPATCAQDLLAAAVCMQPGHPWRCEAVAALAHGHALRLAAGCSPPDAPAVAAAAAGIMSLAGKHTVKVRVMARLLEVLDVLAGLQQQQQQQKQLQEQAKQQEQQPGAAAAASGAPFPPAQLQWLLACCWNAAVETSSSDACVAEQYLDHVAALARFQQLQQRCEREAAGAAAPGNASSGAAVPARGAGTPGPAGCAGPPAAQQAHWLADSQQFKALAAAVHARAASEHATTTPAAADAGGGSGSNAQAAATAGQQQGRQSSQRECSAPASGSRLRDTAPEDERPGSAQEEHTPSPQAGSAPATQEQQQQQQQQEQQQEHMLVPATRAAGVGPDAGSPCDRLAGGSQARAQEQQAELPSAAQAESPRLHACSAASSPPGTPAAQGVSAAAGTASAQPGQPGPDAGGGSVHAAAARDGGLALPLTQLPATQAPSQLAGLGQASPALSAADELLGSAPGLSLQLSSQGDA